MKEKRCDLTQDLTSLGWHEKKSISQKQRNNVGFMLNQVDFIDEI